MHKHFKWARLGLGLLLASMLNTSFAGTLMQSMSFKPYIGVDYQYSHIKGNGDWRLLMPANYQNGAIFLGNRYHKHFGIELGYYQSIRPQSEMATMSSFDGKLANGTAEVDTNIRLKGFSIEWDVYLPLHEIDKKFNGMLIVGLVTVHPKLTLSNNNQTDLAKALSTVKGVNRTFLRLGIGAEYAEKHWGLRGKVLWDHTQNIHVRVDDAQQRFGTITAQAFKQALTIIFGVFYRF